MSENAKKYNGVIVPMITPFTEDLSIDRLSVSKILKTFTLNKVSAFILGTTGESVSIPEEQKTMLVRTVVEESRLNILVYASISGNCLKECIDTGNRYADMGVDVVVIHLPFFYPLSRYAMLKYFEAVAEAVHCPVVLYNNPLTVRWSTPLDVIDKLSTHPNIVGYKDSEAGLERVDKSIQLWSKRPDFSYLVGCAAQSTYALLKGCDGIVPSAGNLVPGLYKALYENARDGNAEEAYAYQALTDKVAGLYHGNQDLSHAIPALKAIMAGYDLCDPYVLPPMYETASEMQESLSQEIRKILNGHENPTE